MLVVGCDPRDGIPPDVLGDDEPCDEELEEDEELEDDEELEELDDCEDWDDGDCGLGIDDGRVGDCGCGVEGMLGPDMVMQPARTNAAPAIKPGSSGVVFMTFPRE